MEVSLWRVLSTGVSPHSWVTSHGFPGSDPPWYLLRHKVLPMWSLYLSYSFTWGVAFGRTPNTLHVRKCVSRSPGRVYNVGVRPRTGEKMKRRVPVRKEPLTWFLSLPLSLLSMCYPNGVRGEEDLTHSVTFEGPFSTRCFGPTSVTLGPRQGRPTHWTPVTNLGH